MLLTHLLIRFGLNTPSSNLIIAVYQKQSIAINTSTGGFEFPRVFAAGFYYQNQITFYTHAYKRWRKQNLNRSVSLILLICIFDQGANTC